MIDTAQQRSSRVETVTDDTFDALVLHGDGPTVVEFMSYGCAHCRLIEPVLQRVAGTLYERERFFRVNIGVERELSTRYAIEGTPTFVMFLDGREVGRTAGPRPTAASLTVAVTRPFES